MERRSWIELLNNGGYFSKFDWMPEGFNNFKEMLKQDRLLWQEKHENIHGKNTLFVSNPKKPKMLPHQSEFQSAQGLTTSFLNDGDPYEANTFDILEEKWINDSKMLFGFFK